MIIVTNNDDNNNNSSPRARRGRVRPAWACAAQRGSPCGTRNERRRAFPENAPASPAERRRCSAPIVTCGRVEACKSGSPNINSFAHQRPQLRARSLPERSLPIAMAASPIPVACKALQAASRASEAEPSLSKLPRPALAPATAPSARPQPAPRGQSPQPRVGERLRASGRAWCSNPSPGCELGRCALARVLQQARQVSQAATTANRTTGQPDAGRGAGQLGRQA